MCGRLLAPRAAFAIAVLLGAGPGLAAPRAPATAPAPVCAGEYASSLELMSPRARAFEASPEAGSSTFCIRSVATYEHVYYGQDGKLQRRYVRHVRHGTAFAYERQGGTWYVATNQHVAEHPAVTSSDGDVEGVPAGSRKIRESVRIVASESDDDLAKQIPLTPVVSDAALDVAVLASRQPLHLMPYRIGRSGALRTGNAVQVRGYPLGVFAAANTGRVISTGQPDRERGWSHEDFAIDALLNPGNSGSPVFALSCRTGELELVGIYHAGYADAQALNVVVSVDQLRQLLRTRRLPDRPAAAAPDRRALAASARAQPSPFLMPFGDRAVRVEVAGDVVRFALLDPDFPLTSDVHFALVDRGDLTHPAALLVPERLGDRELPWSALDAALRDPAQRLHDALWRQLAAVVAFRREAERRVATPEQRGAAAAAAAGIRATRVEQRELIASIDLDADELQSLDRATPAATRP